MSIKENIDSIIAFISGDLLTTLVVYFIGIEAFDWVHPVLKLLMAFLIGAVGGLGGLVIKDFYPVIKKKLKL